MQTEPRYKRSHMMVLRLLTIALIATGLYAIDTLHRTSQLYDSLAAEIAAEPAVAETVKIGSEEMKIPTYRLFKQGQLWALVSKAHPLKGEAGYALIDIPVAHGDDKLPMKVASDISDE